MIFELSYQFLIGDDLNNRLGLGRARHGPRQRLPFAWQIKGRDHHQYQADARTSSFGRAATAGVSGGRESKPFAVCQSFRDKQFFPIHASEVQRVVRAAALRGRG